MRECLVTLLPLSWQPATTTDLARARPQPFLSFLFRVLPTLLALLEQSGFHQLGGSLMKRNLVTDTLATVSSASVPNLLCTHFVFTVYVSLHSSHILWQSSNFSAKPVSW